MQLGIGKATAKTILFGEHSVVYGYPAVAIPLKNLTTTVTIKQANKRGITFNNQNIPINVFRQRFSGIFQLIQDLRLRFQFEGDVTFNIETNIPTKSGLGSSASITVALIRSFYDYMNTELDETDLIREANDVEMVNHVNASGVDVQTIVQQAPILYSKSEGFTKLHFHQHGYLILIDSGISGDTSVAVEKVRNFYNTDPDKVTKIFEEITENEKSAMTDGVVDFGHHFNINQSLLKKLGVSTQEIDSLIERVLDLGAQGAKLTGGGLGGSIIAYVEEQKTAEYIQNQLADLYSIWVSKL
ncbi:MAG: mevalonate kinase [Lactobacillaceae bacterium]|jgi:mevalonate kinase|nr:mevalonate kinase [Lactobacillaceae bacterium]